MVRLSYVKKFIYLLAREAHLSLTGWNGLFILLTLLYLHESFGLLDLRKLRFAGYAFSSLILNMVDMLGWPDLLWQRLAALSNSVTLVFE